MLAAQPSTVAGAFRLLLCRPSWLLWQWNWKAAVLSSATRGGLFFAANLSAGPDAARAALVTEFLLRATTAGFYGATTQAFRAAEPVWAATLTVSLLLPLMTHTVEFIVHWARGTAELAASISVSAAFTLLSTQFSLYAMRRHALIVGAGSDSLAADMRRLPGIVAGFCTSGVSAMRAAWRPRRARAAREGLRRLLPPQRLRPGGSLSRRRG